MKGDNKKYCDVEKYAELYKVLSNQKRLHIIRALEDGELSVEDLAKRLHMSATNVSQHLSHLRYTKLVKTRRDKTKVIYRLGSTKLLELREVLCDFLGETMG